MKTYSTRSDLHTTWKTIREIIAPLCDALEISNRSDSEARHGINGEEGNLPLWASSHSVYGSVQEAIDKIIWGIFEVPLSFLDVQWGAAGAGWRHDLFEALAKALVKAPAPAPAAIARRIQRAVDNATLNPELTKAQVRTLVLKCLAGGLITTADNNDIARILADKTQCAEDALSELQSSIFANA